MINIKRIYYDREANLNPQSVEFQINCFKINIKKDRISPALHFTIYPTISTIALRQQAMSQYEQSTG